MWPDRRLIDLFGIEHPLVLAPMAGCGTVALATVLQQRACRRCYTARGRWPGGRCTAAARDAGI
jgi:hypothetical protein